VTTDPSTSGPTDPADPSGPDDIDEAIIVAISDYLDGALAAPERSEVERKIAGDATWKRVHAELLETRNFLSGMRKAHAPETFTENVAETIHKRSAGRFFARRTLGDRVPFGAVLAVALAGLVVIAYVLWSSSTGSLKVDGTRPPPPDSSSLPRP
jgi:anti-sigma factor RsiW